MIGALIKNGPKRPINLIRRLEFCDDLDHAEIKAEILSAERSPVVL